MHQVKKAYIWLFSGVLTLFAPFICCIGPVLALVFGAGAATSAIAFTDQYSGLFFALSALSFGFAAWKLFYKKRRIIGQPIRQVVLSCPHCGHQKTVIMRTELSLAHTCEKCKTPFSQTEI